MTRRDWIVAMLAPTLLPSSVRAQEACVWGTPEWLPEPILTPTEPYEQNCAMPFSDGCWWDEDRQRYRLWYMAGYRAGTALAESRDGYHFEKLGLIDARPRDSSTVWHCDDGSYVRATYFVQEPNALTVETSRDGRQWTRLARTVECGDRSTIYRAGERWILSARANAGARRVREYYASEDMKSWTPIQCSLIDTDALDQRFGDAPQLYNVDAAPFRGNYIALGAILAQEGQGEMPKRTLLAAFVSDDGLTWRRGPRQFIKGDEDNPRSWHQGNIQSCGGCCVQLKDGKLAFYVSARSGPSANQRCVTGMLTMDPQAVCLG